MPQVNGQQYPYTTEGVAAAKAASQTGAEMAPEEMGPEALQPGKTGDGAKNLLAAIQNLHSYIATLTDPQEQMMVRNLIQVITKLVAQDQQRVMQEIEASMAPQEPTLPQMQTPRPTNAALGIMNKILSPQGGGQLPQMPTLQ